MIPQLYQLSRQETVQLSELHLKLINRLSGALSKVSHKLGDLARELQSTLEISRIIHRVTCMAHRSSYANVWIGLDTT